MCANRRSSWLSRIFLLGLFSVAAGSAAWAQTPQADRSVDTTLIPGTTVWITNSGGREDKGRVVEVSGDVVTTTVADEIRRFRMADVQRITVRESDSVLNGALIGAGVAVASGLFLCRLSEPWRNCRDDVGPMLRIGAIGAGVGIGIDALIRGRRTIYESADGSTRLTAAPILARHKKGLQVSLSF